MEKKSSEEEKKSFWNTLPGILTGIAAIITAVGSCIAIVVSSPRILDLIFPVTPTPTLVVQPVLPTAIPVVPTVLPTATPRISIDTPTSIFFPSNTPTPLQTLALPDLIICSIDTNTSKITICNIGTKAALVKDLMMSYRPPAYEKPGYSGGGDLCGIIYCDEHMITAMIPPSGTFVFDWTRGFGEGSEYMISYKQQESDTSNNCVNVYASIVPCRSD